MLRFVLVTVEARAMTLLRKHAPTEELYRIVAAHSRKVRDVALRIARECPGVDLGLVETGALLHDIGRFVCPRGPATCRHGLEGAEILRSEGLQREAGIAERHVGAGITRREIVDGGLPLPPRDFLPLSPEERIVCHADNLVSGDRERRFGEYLAKLERQHGPEVVARAVALRDSIRGLQGLG